MGASGPLFRKTGLQNPETIHFMFRGRFADSQNTQKTSCTIPWKIIHEIYVRQPIGGKIFRHAVLQRI